MPRFVLLEHRWDGVHWDFMLEDGDVLRTWAIDAQVVSRVELPARALPNHRRFYLDYEGYVSGNRGTVTRIDEGFYTALIWEEGRVRVRLDGAQLVGVVDIRQVGIDSAGAPSWIFRLGNLD
jgi:DNA polymerase Ligase (LigD)